MLQPIKNPRLWLKKYFSKDSDSTSLKRTHYTIMQTTSTQDGKNSESPKSESTSSTKTDWLNRFSNIKSSIKHFLEHKLRPSTAESIGWIGLVLLLVSLIPTFLAIMAGITDKMPAIDLVLFMWGALVTFFIRAAILRDTVVVLTVGIGFMVNAVFMALILFK